MINRRLLRGIELRYALTLYLHQHGPQTVSDLVDALEYQGFEIIGRPSKSVSDALRWETAHGRVCRTARGKYRPLEMPRSTEYRIHKRVVALRAEAARLTGRDDDTFWDRIARFS
ncbi:hypothetical protein [Mycolicibacterium baixiangningiae]|uniref:hypothetical protein n=1 Tax=Mycolicibacterium baixiangningiae TaxID=2761578 RepID=UPI0018D00339|nr:hypothetical protein [Mycolicibacterium baixiangningiae]